MQGPLTPSGGRVEIAMASASSLVSLWRGCTVSTVPSVHEAFHKHCSQSPQPPPRRSGARDTWEDRRQCSTQAVPVVECLLTLKMSDSQEGRTTPMRREREDFQRKSGAGDPLAQRERSDERHVQRGAPSRDPVGTDPRTGLSPAAP